MGPFHSDIWEKRTSSPAFIFISTWNHSDPCFLNGTTPHFFKFNIFAYNTTRTCRVSFLCNNTCPIVQESNNYWILLWVPLEKSQVPNRTFWLENPEMNQSDGHWEQIKYIYYSNTGLKTGWADNHWVYTSWCSSGNAAAPSSIFILFNVFECSSLICWRIGRMYIVSLKICSQSAEKKNKF